MTCYYLNVQFQGQGVNLQDAPFESHGNF